MRYEVEVRKIKYERIIVDADDEDEAGDLAYDEALYGADVVEITDVREAEED